MKAQKASSTIVKAGAEEAHLQTVKWGAVYIAVQEKAKSHGTKTKGRRN